MADDEREGFRGGRFEPSRGVLGQASVDVQSSYPPADEEPRVQGPALGLRHRRAVWAHAQYQGGARLKEHDEDALGSGWRRVIDMSAAELGAIIGPARSFEQAMALANDWVRCHAHEAS